MSIGIVYLRPVRVIYLRKAGCYSDSARKAWTELLGLLDSHGVRQQFTVGYGVLNDDPEAAEEASRRYDACVPLAIAGTTSLADTLPSQMLVGGVYLRLNHNGDIAAIKPLLSRLRTEEVARRGLVIDSKRPCLEIYANDPGPLDEASVRVDLAVPVAS